jgi:hypothetical protein
MKAGTKRASKNKSKKSTAPVLPPKKKKYFTYIPKTLRVEVSVLALSPEIDDRGEVEAKILFHPVYVCDLVVCIR